MKAIYSGKSTSTPTSTATPSMKGALAKKKGKKSPGANKDDHIKKHVTIDDEAEVLELVEESEPVTS